MKAPVDVPRARDYLRMLAGGWVVIALATLLSPAAAYGLQKVTWDRTYTASTLLFAQVAGDPGTFSAYFGGSAANARMATYVSLAQSAVVSRRTVDELGLPMPADELAANTAAAWEPGGVSRFGRASSALLRVQVTGTDSDVTVQTVNALSAQLMRLTGELEWIEAKPTDPIQYTGPVAELVPVDAATSATEVQPPVLRTIAVAGGVGFALSVLLVLGVGIARDDVLSKGQLVQVANTATSGKANVR